MKNYFYICKTCGHFQPPEKEFLECENCKAWDISETACKKAKDIEPGDIVFDNKGMPQEITQARIEREKILFVTKLGNWAELPPDKIIHVSE